MPTSHQTSPRRAGLALLLVCLAAVTACTEPETYPITGEECGPDDPVKGMDASDCPPIV